MIVYKVCEIKDGVYRPFITAQDRFRYDIGNPTVQLPGFGPLCAFSTLEDALLLINGWKGHIIFECEAIKSTEDSVWTMYERHTLDQLRPNAVLCSSITPIKVVHRQ